MSGLSGQCLCGAVKFDAKDVDRGSGLCHCRMCQQWAGGPFIVATSRGVTFTGEENLVRYRSSEWAERGFCRQCGSNLFYRALNSDAYEMCVGAFNEPEAFTLESEIFIDRKPGGYSFTGDHRRLTEGETLAKYPEWAD